MAIPVDGQITLAPRDTATSATRRRWRFGRAGGNGRIPKPNAEKAQAGAGDLAVASVGEQRQLEGHAHPEGLSPCATAQDLHYPAEMIFQTGALALLRTTRGLDASSLSRGVFSIFVVGLA